MIDNIRFSKRNLTDNEVKTIVKKSHLQTMFEAKTGKIFYATGTERQLFGGMFIKIDVDNNLVLKGSLHKYYSFLNTGKNTNYGIFTMPQAKETFLKLIKNKGIENINLKVNQFEVGINLNFDIDVISILENVYAIGSNTYQREIHIDPNYRQKRYITTERSTNIRVYYKLYDKVFEMINKRHPPPKEKNILRIETTNRKLQKRFSKEFFTDSNLNIIQDKFFSKWDDLRLISNIDAPKGTHKSRIDLVKEIYKNAPIPTLKKYNKLLAENEITIKIHRNVREFVNNWKTEHKRFKIVKSPIGEKWAGTYNTVKEHFNKNRL